MPFLLNRPSHAPYSHLISSVGDIELPNETVLV